MYVARVKSGRSADRILAENPWERRPLGRLRRRWGHNVITDLQEVGWEGGGLDWITLA